MTDDRNLINEIVTARNKFRSEYLTEPDELVMPSEDMEELLSAAQYRTKQITGQIDFDESPETKVCGLPVVESDLPVGVMRADLDVGKKAIPLKHGSRAKMDVNQHYLVESENTVTCIDCEREFTNLNSTKLKKYALGYFFSNECPENRKI